jgi:hypothetical protein
LTPDRYARGREKLAEVDGSAGEAVVDSLGDLGRHIVEYAFGDAGFPAAINAMRRLQALEAGESNPVVP